MQLQILSGQLDYLFPTVDPGKTTSIIVPVVGATPGPGNAAIAGFSNILPAGCHLSAQVVAPGKVAVALTNSTGSSVNPGSGTIAAVVFSV